MRIIQRGLKYSFGHRPFQGGLGSAVYVGTGAAADSIEYRSGRIFDGANRVLFGGETDFGDDNVQKTKAVAFAKSPDKPTWAIPASLADTTVWFQVRSHEEDLENESIYGARKIALDSNRDDASSILGSGYVIRTERRDSGGLRVHFAWRNATDGIQPTQFVLTKTAGPGDPIEVKIYHASNVPLYKINVPGLQDAQAYTFELKAINGSTELVIDNAIAFTADAAGPPAVTGVTIEEY